jgi:MtN3 and saliva related transmembrane protein
MLADAIGLVAAVCISAAYFPQLWRSFRTQRTDDLSLVMLLILITGVGLWVAYGILRKDWVIITGNGVSVCCLAVLLYFKAVGLRRSQRE